MVLRITVRPADALPVAGDVGNDETAFTVAQQRLADAERELADQHAARQVAQARALLDELDPPEPEPDTVGQGGERLNDDDLAGVSAARQQRAGLIRARRDAIVPEARPDAAPIVRDVVRGIPEIPFKGVVGGMRDAVQSAADFFAWAGEQSGPWLALANPVVNTAVAAKNLGLKLPEISKPETVTANLVRGVTQFLTGFAAGGGVASAAGATSGVANAAARGFLSDFLGFQGHEANLARLLREHAALNDPVTAFLATDPKDSEAVNRLRRAVEGLGLGVVAEGLVRGVKMIRDHRRAIADGSAEQAVARETAKATPEAPPLTLLGQEDGALLAKAVPPGPSSRTRPGEAGVPDDVVARSLTPEGLEVPTASFSPGEGFRPLFGEGDNAVYVNWARIRGEADVQRVMADMLRAFPGDIAKARRVVRKDKDVQAEAANADAFQALLARRTGEPLSDTQTMAARALWEGSAEHLMDVAAAAARAGTPEAHAQMYRMIDIHRGIQAMVLGARADAARSLRSWGVEHGMTGSQKLGAIQTLIETRGGPERAADLAQRLAALRNLPELAGDLDRFLEKSTFAKSVAAVKQIWVNFLLSSPLTHIRNIMGNSAALTFGLAERAAARGYSRALGSGEVQPGEAAALAFGQMAGIRDGLRLFAQSLRAGESQFSKTATKISEVGHEPALSAPYWKMNSEAPMGRAVDALGTLATLPSRFLLAEDDFFKAVAYRSTIAAHAHRQAQREVAAGALQRGDFDARVAQLVAEPPEHIRMSGMTAAQYQTFTDEPGKLVQAINRLDRQWSNSDNPGAQLAALGMRLLIPFRNTPARLLNYTFERTPLAPLTNTYREAVARGGADADIAKARLALGSFALLGMMDLAFDGRINGGGPSARRGEERGTRQTAQQSGWLPYSVRAGDRYFSFANLDPGGTAVGIAADLAEIMMNADLDDETRGGLHEAVAAATFAFASQVLDKTWMQGTASFVNTLAREQTAGRFVERIGASLLTPNLFPYLRRQADPTMRMSHDLVTRLRDRIPGLSSSLPPARDIWGRERTYQSGLGAVYDAASPVLTRKFEPAPIDRDALRYGFNLSMPPRSVVFQGERYPLDHRPEAYSRYVELQGQFKPSDLGEVRADLDRLRRRDLTPAELLVTKYGDKPLLTLLNEIAEGKNFKAHYDGLDAREKDRWVSSIIADYRRAARVRLFDEFPDLKTRVRGYRWRFPGVEAVERFAAEPD